MLKQLSIFAENNRGAMRRITSLLAGAGIDLENAITNDSAEFGIVRLLVDDPDKAMKLLRENGYMCHVDKVIAVEISDSVGGLDKLLDAVEYSNVNIDYLYVSFHRSNKLPVAVLHADGYPEVEECLRDKGFTLL